MRVLQTCAAALVMLIGSAGFAQIALADTPCAAPQSIASPGPQWIDVTPPCGTRWKAQDQTSTVQSGDVQTDGNGHTWLLATAAQNFSITQVLVQLVADTSGTDLYYQQGAQGGADADWGKVDYLPIASNTDWRNVVTEQRKQAFLDNPNAPVSRTVILPVYVVATTGQTWTSPADGAFPAGAELSDNWG